MAQTTTTQLGPTAIAHPAGVERLPDSAPQLHHFEQKSENLHEDLTFPDLPPFPDDVPTAPLLRLNLQRLLDHDAEEEDKLWRACRDLGFFYLDLRAATPSSASTPFLKRDSPHDDDNPGQDGEINGPGLLQDADALFPLGEHVFALPPEEKQSYDFKDQGSYFGYKGLGAGVIDSQGTKDRNEFYNVSKDDVLGLSTAPPLPAPAVLRKEASRALLARFMRRSHAVVALVLRLLSGRLGLVGKGEAEGGRLESLHRLRGRSGDQVRWVRAPPRKMDEEAMALGEHTDFGSVTVLFNRLGGLQILPPGASGPEGWCYVRPLRGHCVVNLGDAMVKFTAGVLRSNLHRVVSPPGEQEGETRMSLVYFARPEDEVMLRALEGSRMIDEKKRAQE